MRCRFQKHTRLSVSVITTTANQRGLTRSRSFHEPSTDTSAGKRRYSDAAVAMSMRMRMTTLRRLGVATVPVARVSSIAALIATTWFGMGGSVSPGASLSTWFGASLGASWSAATAPR